MSTEKNPFEKYTEIASTEIRKIISGIILAIFGLAFKDNHFDFQTNKSLKYALVLFFIYMLIDLLQYLIGTYYTSKSDINAGRRLLLTIFYLKFVPAIFGFFLTINSIIKIINI